MASDDGSKRDAGSSAGRRRASVTIDVPADGVKESASEAATGDQAKVPVSTVAEDQSRPGGRRASPRAGSVSNDVSPVDPPPRAGSAASLIGFAAMGALVVLLGGYLLLFTGWLPSPGRDAANDAMAETARLADEIEALRLAVEANQAVDLAPLVARVEALEQLEANLGALRQNFDDLARDLEADRVVQTRIAGEIDDLARELVAAAAAAGDPQAAALLADEIGALSARPAALEAAGPPELLPDVRQRLGDVETAVAELNEQAATLAANAADRDRVAGAARLLALNNVQEAADRGEGFTQELAILGELGVDQAVLATLEAVAGDGAPSRAELAETFDDVADSIFTALNEPDAYAGFWDRLWENARGVVTVTPTVPIDGDTPTAIVSRMRAAVEAGDVSTALAERLSLPEAGLAASAAWADNAGARIALDRALADLADTVQRGQAE